MMKLPTNGKKDHSGERNHKHINRISRLLDNKGKEAVVAHSVHTLAAQPVDMRTKIHSVLKKSTKKTKATRPGAQSDVQSLKKKYGWSWKRSLKIASVFGVIFLIATVLLTGVGVAFAIDAYQKAPVINQSSLQAKESSIVYMRDGKTEIFRFYDKENRKNVSLDQIPLQVQYAVIGLEEKDFYKQDLPWLSIVRAVQDCALAKVTNNASSCAGASGLAQQLYRNVTGDKLNNIQRKIRELFAAKKLLDSNSKDQILELYLNWVPFGKNIAGVQVAAEEYFGKDIKDVTLPQACMIASMPQNPANFESGIDARENKDAVNYKFWEALQFRKNICLDNLYQYDIKGDGKKLIENQEQLNALKAEDLKIIPRKDNRKYPHFQDFVEKELQKIFPNSDELNGGGYKIVTTLDPAIQEKLDATYDSEDNKSILATAPVNNAAAVILDGPTGEILGLRGSMDYNNTNIDGQVNIVDSGQAPGSSMKPYVYITAFEQGFNPSTTMLDASTDFGGGYKPANDAGGALGPITIRYALQNSVNITAIRSAYLAQGGGEGPDGTLGISKVVETAEKMGLRFPKQSEGCKLYVTTALGACDVNMLSHATGYNTIAQDGNLRTATPFISITREPRATKTEEDKKIAQSEADADNKRIQDKLNEIYPKKDAVIDPLVAREMQQVMSDSDMRADGFGSTRQYLIFPGWKGKVGAKTGTATGGDDNRATDLWTAGYTKKYTVVSWAGNTRNELIQGSGNTFSVYHVAPTWQKVMQFLHEGLDPNAAENNFSTEGLVRADARCPQGTRGGSACGNEWMTPAQADIIKQAQAKFAKADYNPYEHTIFDNRSELFVVKKYVSKFDRKVVDKDKFPPEYVEEVECVMIPSAFPKAPNWRGPADAYAGRLQNKCNERSSIDPNALGVDITVSPGLSNGDTLKNPIQITAKGKVENQNIKRIEFKVAGSVKDAADGSTLTVNPSTLGLGDGDGSGFFVTINVVDTFDKNYEFNYSGIKFDKLEEFSKDDYSALTNIQCNAVGVKKYNCSFNLPPNRGWNQGNTLKMTIGSNNSGSFCNFSYQDKKFTCNDVPRGDLTSLIKLKGSQDSDFIATGSSVSP